LEEVVFEVDSFHFNKSCKDIMHSIYFWQLGMCALEKASPFLLVTCVLEFQNTKNEMLEPYHGDKLLNTKKT
jgi:hypothetical protein